MGAFAIDEFDWFSADMAPKGLYRCHCWFCLFVYICPFFGKSERSTSSKTNAFQEYLKKKTLNKNCKSCFLVKNKIVLK